jgi:hypothetical protein
MVYMLTCPTKKNKIDLSNYNYELDIQNRLFMAHLSTFDIEVLEEILNSSLSIKLQSLLDYLEASLDDVLNTLESFSSIGLVKLDGDTIRVDKEKRKYYEFQILKFDNAFKPNIDFLQSLLRKVPIHALPTWYALSRTSDNIFSSILEKYLDSPKLFKRYLSDLHFEDPIMMKIVNDVYSAPQCEIRSRTLRDKYSLSREEFEYYMLHLEFNFLCCLSYRQVGESWKEVVTPFHEWREYLRFLHDTEPQPLDTKKIKSFRENDFSFVQDSAAILGALATKKLTLASPDALTATTVKAWMKLCGDFSAKPTKEEIEKYTPYFIEIVTRLIDENLASLRGKSLTTTALGKKHIKASPEDQAIFFSRSFSSPSFKASATRSIRELENSLTKIKNLCWISFDAFTNHLTIAMGAAESPHLIKKGKRWLYALPEYNATEKAMIHEILFKKLFHAGVLDKASYNDVDYFRITEFGHVLLGTDK